MIINILHSIVRAVNGPRGKGNIGGGRMISTRLYQGIGIQVAPIFIKEYLMKITGGDLF